MIQKKLFAGATYFFILKGLIPCVLCLAAHDAVGQSRLLPSEPLQERFIGASGQEDFRSATTNWRGDLAAVGNASPGQEGGQDILLAIFDAQLNRLTERHIGRQADDGAHHIAALPDGRYAIAGYSTTPPRRNRAYAQYAGQRDGWLLLLDERGNTEAELIRGTAENDEFVAVAAENDGNLWVAGNSGSAAWILRLSPTLEVQWEQRLRYHHLPTQASGAYLTGQGDFFIVGHIEEMGRRQMWLIGFDAQGRQILEKTYPHSLAQQGVCVRPLAAERLLVAGNTYTSDNREQGGCGVLSKTGEHLHYSPLGGREFDQASTAILLSSGHVLIGGSSASYERGSRRLSGWVVALEQNPPALKEVQTRYYGSKLNDEIYAFVEHPDGRLFALGTTSRQVLRLRQGWLLQLLPRSEKKSKSGHLTFQLQTPIYPQNRSFLLEKERLLLPVLLENMDKGGACHLLARVSSVAPEGEKYLRIPGPQAVQFAPLGAGERRVSVIPISFSSGIPAGEYTLKVQFYQGDTPFGPPQLCQVRVGQRSTPQLELGVHAPDSAFLLGRQAYLPIRVRNLGDAMARGLTLYAKPHEGLVAPGAIPLGDLAPGGDLTYLLPITPTALPDSPLLRLPLQLRLADSSLLYSATAIAEISVQVPVQTLSVREEQPPVIVWVYPNPDNFDRAEIQWTQEEITVQVKIVSAKPIKRHQFCLEINGQPCVPGTKFDEVRMRGERGSWTFSQTVRLREGKNSLKAVLRDSVRLFASDAMEVRYTPSRPNLHILAIGVPSADLKYTVKDARDFAITLSNGQNAAFDQIFTDTLLTEETTTKTEILKAFRRLQYRYDALQLLPKDVLVVFISAHGLASYDGSFRIAASDYDGPFLRETSLDFEQEILNYLQTLPCHKLILVDACQSGTASAATLAGIVARRHNMDMLVSCQPDEYSYEDDAWQNGAFTRALVMGLQTFAKTPAALDQNRDQRLDLAELFAFVQKETPALVEKKRPRPKTSQRPHLTLADPTRPIILWQWPGAE